jgi:hypothetical protein
MRIDNVAEGDVAQRMGNIAEGEMAQRLGHDREGGRRVRSGTVAAPLILKPSRRARACNFVIDSAKAAVESQIGQWPRR